MSEGRPLKVHVTGAYGLIGNLTYRHLSGKNDYEAYGSGRRTASSDRIDDEDLLRIPDDRFSLADLTDRDAVSRALSGMDAVVHLGAVPDPGASFETILESNIRGTYNVLEVCREEGIRRLIYASSVMASWGYGQFSEPYKSLLKGHLEGLPDPMPIVKVTDPPRPTEPYSASKVWGEGICRTYHDAHDFSVVCLRIGWVNKDNEATEPFLRSVWCSQQDITQIIELALKATENPVYEVCYAVTDGPHRWVDLEHTRDRLGHDITG